MRADPVVEEVRERGRAVTARHGNDVSAILRVLAEKARNRPAGIVGTVKVVAGADSKGLGTARS